MSILGKKRGPDIDFTLLQKKGLIKKSPVKKTVGWKVDKAGFIEMPAATSVVEGASASGLGFLENMVDKQNSGNAGGNVDPNPLGSFLDNPLGFNPPTPPSPSDGGPGSGGLGSLGNIESDLSSLRVKLDDLEYKLERLLERLDKIESSKS